MVEKVRAPRRWRLLAVAFLLALAPPAQADVAAGWAAYLGGDYVTAVTELEPDAEAGNAEAQFYMGTLREHGAGVPKDYGAALEWYRRAATQGHTGAAPRVMDRVDRGAAHLVAHGTRPYCTGGRWPSGGDCQASAMAVAWSMSIWSILSLRRSRLVSAPGWRARSASRNQA